MKKRILLPYAFILALSTACGQDQEQEVVTSIKPSPELLEEIRQHPDKINKELCSKLIASWTSQESSQEDAGFEPTIELSENANDILFMYEALRPAFIAQLYPEFAQTISEIKTITKEYKHESNGHYIYQKYAFTPVAWDATKAIEAFKELSPMEQKTILSLWVEEEASFGQPTNIDFDEEIFFDDFFDLF